MSMYPPRGLAGHSSMVHLLGHERNGDIRSNVSQLSSDRPYFSVGTDSCDSSVPSSRRTTPHTLLRRRNLVLISATSVVFSLLSFIILAIMFLMQMSPSWEENTFAEGAYEACVPCIYLKSDAGDDASNVPEFRTLKSKIVNDQAYCCARTSGQMSALIQLIAKQQRIKQAFAEQAPKVETSHANVFKFSPVSAHKFLAPKTRGAKVIFKERHEVLTMKTGVEVSSMEHARNVQVRKNSLNILHSGWYFVYSNVYFRPRFSQPCRHLKYQTWGHYIMRLRPGRPTHSGVLIKTAHTCCDDCVEDHHSSYVGGVFRLEKGDQIYIEVSAAGLVRFEGTGTFLGLVMLGSGDEEKPKER